VKSETGIEAIDRQDVVIAREEQEADIIDILNKEGATDKWIASSLVDIAINATSTHVDKNGNEWTAEDYKSRLWAIKELARMRSEARKSGKSKKTMIIKLVQ